FDRLHELLHAGRLARLRRRHDEAALALADRGDEVDDARRHVGGGAGLLEPQLLVGEQRRQVLEPGPAAGQLGILAVDGVDAQQRRVLLVATRRTHGTGDVVTAAQAELPGLLDRDVAV